MISARRKRHLALACLAIFGYAGGIPITRLLDSYRGVVIEEAGDRAHVAYLDRMPRWRRISSAVPVTAGAIVLKARGAWGPKVVEPLGQDMALMALYERFYASYEARIVRIDRPDFLGPAATAVAEKADGSHVTLTLAAPHLTAVQVGTQLRKMAKAWDPVVIQPAVALQPEG